MLSIIFVLFGVSYSQENCCSTCLGQGLINGFDALNFKTCTQGGGGVCCFEASCRQSEMGSMTFSTDIDFENGNPVVNQGQVIQFQWLLAERVTYIVVADADEKDTQPLYTSEDAALNNGWFQICTETPGKVYIRGWKDAGCSASTEFSIRVREGGAEDCSMPPPSIPTRECNLNRASIKGMFLELLNQRINSCTLDGECVCGSDWQGARRWHPNLHFTTNSSNSV